MITFKIELWNAQNDILDRFDSNGITFDSLLSGTDRDIRVRVRIPVQAESMKEWASGSIVKAGDNLIFKAYQIEDGGTPELIWEQALVCQELDFEWSLTAMIYTIEGKGTRT